MNFTHLDLFFQLLVLKTFECVFDFPKKFLWNVRQILTLRVSLTPMCLIHMYVGP